MMSPQKWGESFLKSGLPLEHLVLMTLKSLGWSCEPHWEYRRVNREGAVSWFEVDLIAYSPGDGPTLHLVVECKYHDDARSWFFLPCETEDHLAQHEALSAGANLHANAAVVHSAPYELLAHPESEELLTLAPLAVWGVTVSQDGSRQPNAIEEATKQLAFSYIPFCLDHMYGCYGPGASVLPMIVTSARLFRLRPTVSDLAQVRDAAAPGEVADELPWLCYYHAPDGQLLDHNMAEIDSYRAKNPHTRRKVIDDQLLSLWTCPHWIAVVNAKGLSVAALSILGRYQALAKDLSGERMIAQVQESRRPKKRMKHQGA